jgi:TRAP-type mannitol/chloroaromatic compound transport system substrate-binding protein
MKRRQFLKAGGFGLATAAIAKPAVAQTNPSIKWRLISSFPKSLDTLYGVSETISKYVAEATASSRCSPSRPVVAGRGVQLRHLHDQVAHAHLTPCSEHRF